IFNRKRPIFLIYIALSVARVRARRKMQAGPINKRSFNPCCAVLRPYSCVVLGVLRGTESQRGLSAAVNQVSSVAFEAPSLTARGPVGIVPATDPIGLQTASGDFCCGRAASIRGAGGGGGGRNTVRRRL